MRRLTMVSWALVVGFWTGTVGAAAIEPPSIALLPAYTVGLMALGTAFSYWTMAQHQSVLADANRPGRMALFILVHFLVSVVLATAFDLLAGHTAPLGIALQLVAALGGTTAGLGVAYAGGFDAAWERYT